jgi:hypothetical protein
VPVPAGQPGRDPFRRLLADRDDIGAQFAVGVFGQQGDVFSGQAPDQLLDDAD